MEPFTEDSERLARFAVKKWWKKLAWIPSFEPDDALQLAREEIWKAQQTYDPEKGAFSTYALRLVIRRFRNECLFYTRKKRGPERHNAALDATINGVSGCLTIADTLASPEELPERVAERLQLQAVFRQATPRQALIVERRLRGETQCEIARAMHLSQTVISAELVALRRTIERKEPGMPYRICKTCGAHLDPDERCDDCDGPPPRAAPPYNPTKPATPVDNTKEEHL